MGTRADFYIGRGENAQWLGSIGWDGYPGGVPEDVLTAKTIEDYQGALADFFAERDDFTHPEQGWPWPWDDSHTSDYAYTFDAGKVWHSTHINYPDDFWWPASLPEPSEDDPVRTETLTRCVFPDMSDIKNVTLGRGSGLIVISA